jgi:hypothetical protein
MFTNRVSLVVELDHLHDALLIEVDEQKMHRPSVGKSAHGVRHEIAERNEPVLDVHHVRCERLLMTHEGSLVVGSACGYS